MKRKVIFNKLHSGNYATKVTIPATFLEVLGFTEEENNALVEISGQEITIKKIPRPLDDPNFRKVIFGNNGSNCTVARVTIPTDFIDQLGIKKDIDVTLKDKKIIIKKI